MPFRTLSLARPLPPFSLRLLARLLALPGAVLLAAALASCAAPETRAIVARTVQVRGQGARLALTMRLSPVPTRLSEARRVEVELSLKNDGKRFVRLDFPTTQRFELLVRDPAQRILARWSDDQEIDPVEDSVGLNPQERLDYHAFFSTRDMQPGREYNIVAFFPSRPELKVEIPVKALK